MQINLSETDRKILEVIKEKQNPGYRSIAAALQRNPAVVRRHVRNCLLERGLVEALEGGGWKITGLGLKALEKRHQARITRTRRTRARRNEDVPKRRDSRRSPQRRADDRRRSFNASHRRSGSRFSRKKKKNSHHESDS